MRRMGCLALAVGIGLCVLDTLGRTGEPAAQTFGIWDPGSDGEAMHCDPGAWAHRWATVEFRALEGWHRSTRPTLSNPSAIDWMEELLPSLRGVPEPLELDEDAGSEGDRAVNGPVQHRQTTQVLGASLTSQVTVNEDRQRWEAPPLPVQPWQTDESLQLPVLGPFFAFGQCGAAPDTSPSRELRVSSRGGIGCKMQVLPGAELQMRGGPVMTFRERLGGEEAQWLVEVQAKYALPLSLGLEYQGAALPALNPAARDRVTQDVRVAVPLGDSGQFRLGARHQWENAPTYRPWGEGMQLYLGVELKRGAPR